MKLKKVLQTAYVIIFFLILGIIGVMSFAKKDNRPLKEKEVVFEPEGYKTLSTAFDKYFSANFGFRKNFININNRIKYTLFNQSGEKNVILGKDGWLFYESALHDYMGFDVLPEEDIRKIAESIKKMQDAVESKGKKFVFTIAPNKMEIYGEDMPYFYLEDEADGNYEKLMKELERLSVNYVDMKSVMMDDKEIDGNRVYHKLDSHWNNLGASLAYMSIMKKAGLSYTDYTKIKYEAGQDFDGDLYEMLFPDGKEKDIQYYFDVEDNYEFTSRFMGADDLLITTHNENGKGSVLFFRDSFGNALFEFFARDFMDAEISRAIPYDITDIDDVDLVVVEIVERNIANILLHPPVFG